MKGLARPHLEAFEVDCLAAVKLEVAAGKIIAHHADQLDRAEKARGHRRMAGRSPSNRGFSAWGVLMESNAVEPTINTLMGFEIGNSVSRGNEKRSREKGSGK